ncbi:MAG TPA: hypothetical protein VKP65_24610 [Rhodothermales bacterium]|nr:hypothetical protein [Rhodothermales bacterium]
MGAAYQISTEQDDIVIRLSKADTDEASLMKLLDYLELESIRRRSQLTEEDAALLAQEIKGQAWQQVKHLFEEA